MSRVRHGDKDFEDYDYDEDEEKEKEEEELEKIHEDDSGEIKSVAPKAKVVKKDDSFVKTGFEECEEPGCERPATKVWKGRKVCADHYDFYREKENSMYTFYY